MFQFDPQVSSFTLPFYPNKKSVWPFFNIQNISLTLLIWITQYVSQGIIEEETLNTFNLPNYYPSPSEVKLEVLTEGSFVINQLEILEANKNAIDNCDGLDIDFEMSRLQHIRAGIEPLLTSHFGENVIEEIFNRYKKILSDRISKKRTSTTNLTITLTRNPWAKYFCLGFIFVIWNDF